MTYLRKVLISWLQEPQAKSLQSLAGHRSEYNSTNWKAAETQQSIKDCDGLKEGCSHSYLLWNTGPFKKNWDFI